MPDLIPAHQPELRTLTEAAALLRAPVATLRYWRHLATGPQSFRAGRRILYRRDDLHTWIADQHDDARGTAGGPDQTRSRTQPGPDQHRSSESAPSVQITTSRR